MLAADPPDLVVGDHTVWRVPVWIGFLHQGRYLVGTIAVDAKTGALRDQEQSVAAIQVRAKELSTTLPPYAPNPDIAVEYLAPNPIVAQNL